jgi:hypothetical protein
MVNIDLYIKALPILLEKLKGSYPTRNLETALQREAQVNKTFGKKIYVKTLETNNPNFYFSLTNILSGLYHSDQKFTIQEVKKLLSYENLELRKVGIQALAKFDLSDKVAPKEFISWIEKHCDDISNQEDLSQLWPSVFFTIRNKRSFIKNVDTIIDKLSKTPTIDIQLELISYLSYNLDLEKEMHLFKKYLPLLLNMNVKYRGAFNQLSYQLSDTLKRDLDLVMKFLTDWIDLKVEHARNIDYFSYVLNTLCDEFYVDFQKLYTNWLNKDNPNFHIAIFEMNKAGEIRDLSGLTFSEEVIKEFTDYDIEYITYKILAYVYDKDTSLSLVYSILEYKANNMEVVRLLADLFVNHFIFNYYSTIEFLDKKMKTASKKLKKIIKDIIKQGEKKYKAYSDLDVMKEFAPSERRLIYYNKIQNRKFSKSVKATETNRNSFLSMIKNINYRTGESTFAKYNGEYTKKMKPALFSHSGEMPRGEFIDPVGQAQERLHWQNFKRRV